MAANLKAHAAPAPQPKPPPKSLSMERHIPLGQHLAEAMAAASAASQALLRRVGLAAPPPPVISKVPLHGITCAWHCQFGHFQNGSCTHQCHSPTILVLTAQVLTAMFYAFPLISKRCLNIFLKS